MPKKTVFSRISGRITPQLWAKNTLNISARGMQLIFIAATFVAHMIYRLLSSLFSGVLKIIDVIATLLSWGLAALLNGLSDRFKGLFLTARFGIQRIGRAAYLYWVRILSSPIAHLQRLTARTVALGGGRLLFKEVKVLRRIIKTLMWCVLIVALMIAILTAVLRFYLLPDLTVLQPYIERHLSAQTKQAVHIEGLKANWEWSSATIDIAQLRMGSKNNATISLQKLHTRIPLYPLLWGTVATQGLSIQQLKLAIKQTGTRLNPHWFAAGIDLNQPSDGTGLRWLLQQANVRVDALNVDVNDAAKDWLPEGSASFAFAHLNLSNTGLSRLNPLNALDSLSISKPAIDQATIPSNAPTPSTPSTPSTHSTLPASVDAAIANTTSTTSAFEHDFSAQFAPGFDDTRLGSDAKLRVQFNHGTFADSANMQQWQGTAALHLPALKIGPSTIWALSHIPDNNNNNSNANTNNKSWLPWLNQHASKTRMASDTVLDFSPNTLEAHSQIRVNHLNFANAPNLNDASSLPVAFSWQMDKTAPQKPQALTITTPALKLSSWSDWVQTMPVPDAWVQALNSAKAQGDLSKITLDVKLDAQGLQTMAFDADVNAASINAFDWQGAHSVVSMPALHNFSGKLTLKHQHPTLTTDVAVHLNSQAATVVLPGVLVNPEITADTLTGDVQLIIDPKAVRANFKDVRLSNVDAAGRFSGHYTLDLTQSLAKNTPHTPRVAPIALENIPLVWANPLDISTQPAQPKPQLQTQLQTQLQIQTKPQTSAPIKPLGVLNLQAQFDRANIASMAKYLPVHMSEKARAWLNHTLLQGQLSQIELSLNGELTRFPFATAHRDEFFKLQANIASGELNLNPVAFVPSAPQFNVGLPSLLMPKPSIDASAQSIAAAPIPKLIQELSPTSPVGEVNSDLQKNSTNFFKHDGSIPYSPLVKPNPNPNQPTTALDADKKTWPLVRGVSGSISLDGTSLKLHNMTGVIAQPPSVDMEASHDFQVRIPSLSIANMGAPVVVFQAQSSAAANNVLHLVRHTPLAGLLGEQFNTLTTQGTVDVDAQLTIDTATPETTQVNGTLKLSDVALTLSTELPPIEHINASARFKQTGFTVEQAKAQWLDGEVALSGGLDTQDTQQSLRLQGRAHLEKIKQYSPNLMAQALLKHAQGAVDYDLDLNVSPQGVRWGVKADLKETRLSWPGFLDKAAGVALPFSLTRTPTQRSALGQKTVIDRDVWQASLGATVLGPFQGTIERQLQAGAWVMQRGAVALGDDADINIPDSGLGVHITGKAVNLDQIQAELSALPWKSLPASTVETDTEKRLRISKAPAWLPSMIAVQVDDLTLGHRHYHDIIAGASRSGARGESWNGNLIAKGINGYLSWTDPSLAAGLGGGQLELKLTELTIPPSELASSKQALLDIAPEQVPSVDLNIDKLTLGTFNVGSVALKANNTVRTSAANHQRERGWDIAAFSLKRPHIDANAKGLWRQNAEHPQGQVSLDFTLNTDSLGDTLNDLHYDKIIAGAGGEVSGKVAWLGTPFGFDVASLSGNIAGQLGKGRFLKADPGAGRLVGLFSLQNLPRRLSLDFKDTFGEGFAFDKVNLASTIKDGQLTMDSLVINSSLATVSATGKVSLTKETQALRFKVKPEINAGSASVLYMIINPVLGLSTLAAQWLFKEPLSDSLTVMYDITGPWTKPEVNPVKRNAPMPEPSKMIVDTTPHPMLNADDSTLEDVKDAEGVKNTKNANDVKTVKNVTNLKNSVSVKSIDKGEGEGGSNGDSDGDSDSTSVKANPLIQSLDPTPITTTFP